MLPSSNQTFEDDRLGGRAGLYSELDLVYLGASTDVSDVQMFQTFRCQV